MRSLGTSTQAFEAYLVAELVFEAAGTLWADNCARGANSYHKLYVTVSRIKYHNGPAQRHPAGSNEHKGNAVRRLGLRDALPRVVCWLLPGYYARSRC